MAGIPVQFRKGGEAAVASYDWTDLAAGTGVVAYTGYTSQVSGAALQYNITSNDSVNSTSGAAHASGSSNTFLNLDFDLTEFNTPRTIKGNILVNFGYYVRSTLSSTIKGYSIITIKKVRNGTPIDIGQQSGAVVNSGAGIITKKIMSIPISVTNSLFKKGDILRVNAYLSASGANDGGCEIVVGTDPQNGDQHWLIPSTDNPKTITKFLAYVPYKIDL